MRPRVRSTLILSALGLSLALNAALIIGLLHRQPTPGGAKAGGEYCLLDRLELDRQQQDRLAGMRRAMHEKRSTYWERSAAIKAELATTVSAAQVDRAALDALLARYAQAQAEMQRAVADHLVGVNAMLRPVQRDAFRTLLRTEMFQGIRATRSAATGSP